MRKKLMPIAAACCLALGLCACGNSGAPNTGPSHDEAVERYEHFRGLIEAQETIYTFESSSTVEFEDGEQNETYTYNGIIDDSSDEQHAFIKITEPAEFAGAEYYLSDGKVLLVRGEEVFDNTTAFKSGNGELANIFEHFSIALAIGPSEIISEEVDDRGNTTFHVQLAKSTLDQIASLFICESGTAYYVFDADNELVEFKLDVTGSTNRAGKLTAASNHIETAMRDYGKGTVPDCPTEVTATCIDVSLTDAQAEIEEILASIPGNITTVTETDTTVKIGGTTQTSNMYIEMLKDAGDTYRSLTYIESNGDEANATWLYQEDDAVTVVQNDEIVSTTEDNETSDASGSEKALEALKHAIGVTLYEYKEDGTREYVVDISPDQYFYLTNPEGIERLTSVQVHYAFDSNGQIQMIAQLINGIPAGGNKSDTIGIETFTWYSDFGTTEVPTLD